MAIGFEQDGIPLVGIEFADCLELLRGLGQLARFIERKSQVLPQRRNRARWSHGQSALVLRNRLGILALMNERQPQIRVRGKTARIEGKYISVLPDRPGII